MVYYNDNIWVSNLQPVAFCHLYLLAPFTIHAIDKDNKDRQNNASLHRIQSDGWSYKNYLVIIMRRGALFIFIINESSVCTKCKIHVIRKKSMSATYVHNTTTYFSFFSQPTSFHLKPQTFCIISFHPNQNW